MQSAASVTGWCPISWRTVTHIQVFRKLTVAVWMMLIRGRKSSYAVVKQTGNLTAGFTCLVSLSQTEIHMHILDLILDMIIGGG